MYFHGFYTLTRRPFLPFSPSVAGCKVCYGLLDLVLVLAIKMPSPNTKTRKNKTAISGIHANVKIKAELSTGVPLRDLWEKNVPTYNNVIQLEDQAE